LILGGGTLIDVAIAGRQKCRTKGGGKDAKIQQFRCRDTANVDLKCTVIPVIIGATGMVTKSLRKNL
jgi:hypothetical protein